MMQRNECMHAGGQRGWSKRYIYPLHYSSVQTMILPLFFFIPRCHDGFPSLSPSSSHSSLLFCSPCYLPLLFFHPYVFCLCFLSLSRPPVVCLLFWPFFLGLSLVGSCPSLRGYFDVSGVSNCLQLFSNKEAIPFGDYLAARP